MASSLSSLLVSVRSVAEAEAALAGGAALIDVKEPARGALGRADEDTVAAVVHFVGKRCPVSAALGELAEDASPFFCPGLAYAKWGLAGCGNGFPWRARLANAVRVFARTDPACRLVPVAYADWRRAQAPPPAEVVAFACEQRCTALLLDTWRKDGTTLPDWLTL